LSTPRASIIISTWNGRHLLETCLPRVLRAIDEDGGDHEVIVVDDASRDDTVSFVRREFPEVKVVALKRNLRFAGANNAGARAAKGELLIFLNNDMLVEPDFLSPLLRRFDDPKVFAATARIEMAPTRVAGGVIQETGLVRARFEEGFFVLRHEVEIGEEPVPVMYVGGGSSAWRREVFFQLRGFDRLFRPFYFEDLDVSYRAQKLGWRLMFAPRSRMVHHHRQTNSPRNFPGGYVDLMFGKNSLLFTWKVLTDRDLLEQHFRALWGRLMRPRTNPKLAAFFLRAAAQLPELLVKRHRSRSAGMVSDRRVIEGVAGPPVVEAAPGERLPYGSSGTGRRVLVVGFAPLPFEKERRLGALCFRTWHAVQALLEEGHEVTLVGCRMTDAYENESERPGLLRFEGNHFTYYSMEHSRFEEGGALQNVCDRVQPEAIVAVHAYGAWAAARLKTEAPLWADLNGYAMAEAQARAALDGSDESVAEAWRREQAALRRADAISVVSVRQKYAVVGELAAVGRLGGGNYGEDRVYYMPNAIEDLPYRHRKRVVRGRLAEEDDFVVLWSGGYNTWTDPDTLFEGVSAAMREEPRVKFVSLGGAMPGRDEKTFYRFRKRVEESEFADRFVFAGWVPTEEVPNYYFESDVGINIDRFSYEMLIGCRYRILDMLRAGLPVITTLGTEISHVVRDERLGLTFSPGDAAALREAILSMARDLSLRRRCAARAKEYVFKHRLALDVMAPLRAWARAPKASGDRLPMVAEPARRGEARAAREPGRGLAGLVSDVGAKLLVRRRGTEPWGLDPAEPPGRALVIRAGPASLTRAVVERMRAKYPATEIAVLAPEPLVEETAFETGVEVLPAPAAGGVSYRVTSGLLGELRERVLDTVVVAGEGSRRAEAIALLCGADRRVEVREDGAAHTFWFAIYKPVMVVVAGVAEGLEKTTLSALVGLVYASLALEGWVWRMGERRRAAAGGRR